MSVSAGKTSLGFEPKMAVLMDATGTTVTPEGVRPTLGYLANLQYKPASFGFLLRLSSAPTVGAATVELVAAGVVIKTITLNIIGQTEISSVGGVILSAVTGEADISARVVVGTAADSGITATLDAVLYVDVPLTVSGC